MITYSIYNGIKHMHHSNQAEIFFFAKSDNVCVAIDSSTSMQRQSESNKVSGTLTFPTCRKEEENNLVILFSWHLSS